MARPSRPMQWTAGADDHVCVAERTSTMPDARDQHLPDDNVIAACATSMPSAPETHPIVSNSADAAYTAVGSGNLTQLAGLSYWGRSSAARRTDESCIGKTQRLCPDRHDFLASLDGKVSSSIKRMFVS